MNNFRNSLGYDESMDAYGFNDDGYDYDGFLKRSPAKKQAKIEKKAAKVEIKKNKAAAKIERKATKQAAKIEKKANRPRVLKVRAKIEQENARNKAAIEETAKDNEAARSETALNNQAEREAAQETGEETPDTTNFTPERQVKVKKYLERRGRGNAIETSPETLAAQFREERGRQINERFNDKINWLDENEEANDDEWYEENYPDYEDIEEEILEEEENEFAFTGDSDNFLDPDTIAVATSVGKKAADLYRQKRFAQGKKAFGMTKAQYEKKQEAQRQAIAEGTDTLSQLKGAAVQESTRQFIGRNPLIIVVGVLLVVSAIAGVVYMNKSSN